jgi:hypothetical protein
VSNRALHLYRLATGVNNNRNTSIQKQQQYQHPKTTAIPASKNNSNTGIQKQQQHQHLKTTAIPASKNNSNTSIQKQQQHQHLKTTATPASKNNHYVKNLPATPTITTAPVTVYSPIHTDPWCQTKSQTDFDLAASKNNSNTSIQKRQQHQHPTSLA